MPYSNATWNRSQVEILMEIATTLGDLTQSLELAAQIPVYLSRVLEIEPLTLAIVHDAGDGSEPALTFRASSGLVATGEAAPHFPQDVLAIYQQTRPLSAADGPTLRPTFETSDAQRSVSEMSVQRLSLFPRATVLARSLDTHHRMLLIVHQRADEALPTATMSALQLTSEHLARLLTSLMNWQTRNIDLGEPFDRLTEREWVVLRGLSTEAGEKQLADQLSLSPHTLHSHIKSIYRKVGVQGRLPLLTKVQEAIRTLRCERIRRSERSMIANTSSDRAVAIG